MKILCHRGNWFGLEWYGCKHIICPMSYQCWKNWKNEYNKIKNPDDNIGYFFDELKNNNKLPFYRHYNINSILYPPLNYVIKREKWDKENNRIKKLFELHIKFIYKVSPNLINTAYEIMDMSDNGFSYKEVEQYIIMLKRSFKLENNGFA